MNQQMDQGSLKRFFRQNPEVLGLAIVLTVLSFLMPEASAPTSVPVRTLLQADFSDLAPTVECTMTELKNRFRSHFVEPRRPVLPNVTVPRNLRERRSPIEYI